MELHEKSPPGFKGTVNAMKKHKEIDNPYALSWYMKNRKEKSHYKDKDGKPEKKEKYKNEHKTFEQYVLEHDLKETEAIVASCKGGPDFQVMGACSDLKKKKAKSGYKKSD